MREKKVDQGSFLTHISSPEDCRMSLHGFLHFQPQVSSGRMSIGKPHLVKIGNASFSGVGGQIANLFSRLVHIGDGLGASTSEHDQIKKGVCPKTVGTVNRSTGSLTSSIETRNHLVTVGSVSNNLQRR